MANSNSTETKRDMKYFMGATEDEIVTAPGPKSFKDENGKVIDFEIKVLSHKEITEINNKYRKRSIATDKKGNPLVQGNEVVYKTERDSDRASRHMMVEALVYPNLKDKDLMDHYKCVDITEMPLLVFRNSDDYLYVLKMINRILGLTSGLDDEGDMEAAKNS